MRSLTKADVVRSLLNTTKGEASSVNLPTDFPRLDWDELEFLGWRDPKAPLRGYLIREVGGTVQGIALRAADTSMSRSITAMCLICRAAASADSISLFTAKRVGPAGRNGNTVGTYICADLRCGEQIHRPTDPARFRAELGLPLEERVLRMNQRLEAFFEDVTRRD